MSSDVNRRACSLEGAERRDPSGGWPRSSPRATVGRGLSSRGVGGPDNLLSWPPRVYVRRPPDIPRAVSACQAPIQEEAYEPVAATCPAPLLGSRFPSGWAEPHLDRRARWWAGRTGSARRRRIDRSRAASPSMMPMCHDPRPRSYLGRHSPNRGRGVRRGLGRRPGDSADRPRWGGELSGRGCRPVGRWPRRGRRRGRCRGR